ncbi:copper amine oxidase N-terminal domain-containing protein [bacterium]|nr:MAG: copper amine oxidase N-terminal domain-containing protein [bacterium]
MTPRILVPILAGTLLVASPHISRAQVPAPAAGASAPVSVLIDGRPLDFGTSPPQSVNGRLLVPLRAIFEALGAQVDFAGGTVRAQRGSTQLQLQIGSQAAVVNGQNRTLDVPAQAIFGRTFVPLRFVGEALGAGVAFNNATQTVSITSPAGSQPGTGGTPTDPIYNVPGTGQTVTGTLLRLDAGTPGSLSMLVDGQIRNYQINQGALVLRQLSIAPSAGAPPVRQAPRATTLPSLIPNETLKIVLDANGRISQLTAQATVIVARVQFGAGNNIILDDANDTSLTLGPNLSYTDQTGRPAVAVNLNAGASVALFISPQGRTIYRVSSDPRDYTAQNTTGPTDPLPGGLPPTDAPTVRDVQTDATTPLKAGGQLTVSATGTPNQRLTMNLGTRIQNVPLVETPIGSGQYAATYTVRTGDDVLDARITVRLIDGNGFESTAQSQTAVTIDTVAPRLVGTIPSNGAQISVAQPNIAISVDDLGGSGIGDATVSIIQNNVTTPIPATVAPPSLVNAVPPQALSGRVAVRAIISDRAGNALPVNFSFTVSRGGAAGAIQSFTQGATRTMAPNEDIPLALVATPNGRASFDVMGARNTIIARDLPLSEDPDTPGTYRGAFRVPDDATGSIRFVGRFDSGDGTVNQSEATAAVRITTAAVPSKLTITSPTQGGAVQTPIVISGKAAAGATVNVSLTASGTRFFVLQYNEDLGTFQARADAQGNWQSQPIPFTKPRNVQGLTLTISATQTDAANRTSDPVEITVTP